MGFREIIQLRGIPLAPSPCPALGRGEPILSIAAEEITRSTQVELFRTALLLQR